MISADEPIAESGKPEAMPFAMIRMSGSMPVVSTANIVPVRPKPACTSSATKSIPCSAQMALRPWRNRAGAGS